MKVTLKDWDSKSPLQKAFEFVLPIAIASLISGGMVAYFAAHYMNEIKVQQIRLMDDARQVLEQCKEIDRSCPLPTAPPKKISHR